ncbi:MAG: hypothetical protein ACYDGY_05280 [Acidimicrobiales bacterium]
MANLVTLAPLGGAKWSVSRNVIYRLLISVMLFVSNVTVILLFLSSPANASITSSSSQGNSVGGFPSSPSGLLTGPPSSPLPPAGPPVGSSGNGGVAPQDTMNACFGAGDPNPPTAWESDANSYFTGGASGFESDMTGIANFMAYYNSAYSYMPSEVSTIADLDYWGSIACRESTFSLTATDGSYLGLFQLSTGDFSGILGS